MNDIFSRVDSSVPLPQVLETVVRDFQLGPVEKFVPILTGYQDCNIDLHTSGGRFVVKLFSSEKTQERINDVIAGYISCQAAGVPIVPLKTSIHGAQRFEIPGKHHPSYGCVFEYIEGKPFTKTPVTDADLVAMSQALARIHTIRKTVRRYYDTMGIINAPHEYKLKQDALSSDEQSQIAPVISKLSRITFSGFHHGIIHGSMEKENILKNTNNEICILDLGCMDYAPTILDIATLIANMTLYTTDEKKRHIIHEIITAYTSNVSLDTTELTALPTLIRGQYAAYIIGMTHRMRKEHDMTKQTQTWLDRGWDGLKAYADIRKLL